MSLPGLSCFLLCAAVFGSVLAAAEKTSPASAPTVWKLTDAHTVGGHTTTILGAPAVKDDASGPAVYFDGTSDGVFVPNNPLAGLNAFTIEVLIKPDSTGSAEQRFFHLQDGPGSRALLEIRLADGQWALDTFLYSVESKEKCALLDRTKTHPADRWTWVALVYANGHMTHYIDGAKELEGTVKFPPTLAGQVSLGVRQNKVYWFKGGIREVHFHASALAADALQQTASAK